jgi:O-antigen/teichoic acid export membrane protein
MAQISSLRRDIISAYVASGAKIASWVVISAIVFRRGGIAEFGMLALIRATVGLLQYASLGLGPAMVKLGAEAETAATGDAALASEAVLGYYRENPRQGISNLYANAISFAAITALIGGILVCTYAYFFTTLHRVPGDVQLSGSYTAAFIGFGLLLRLISDAAAAVLQIRGNIARDNRYVIEAEIVWILATMILVAANPTIQLKTLLYAGQGYLLSSLFLLVRRADHVRRLIGTPSFRLEPEILRSIFRIGGLVTLAQLADFLYAPTDYILINRFLGSRMVANYAPAIQIDAALLLLVSGLAAVLFPRSAVAHAAGDVASVKRYYLRGTLASAAVLVIGSAGAWLLSPLIFRLWLGNPMDRTRQILPLVLIHTIIGGSAMVGRSVLLAVGKFTPFAVSVLLAGTVNVVCSYILAVRMHLGINGIIYGTIIAVVARCLLWMPWYVMRSLNQVRELPAAVATPEV